MLVWLIANGQLLIAGASCTEEVGDVASVIAIVASFGGDLVRARSVFTHRALPAGCGFYFFLGFRFLCGTGTPAGAPFPFSLNF